MENTKNCLIETPLNFEYEQESKIDQEATFFRKLLPNEIWQLVANRLEDLSSLTNSSLYFRNLLSSEHDKYIFAQGLEILIATVWSNDGENGLPFSDVLNCREVCCTWSKVVDLILKHVFHTQQYLLPTKAIPEFESTNNKVSKFLKHFEDSHTGKDFERNPFIGDTLKVVLKNNDEQLTDLDIEFLNNVWLVLSKYGRNIVHFELKLSEGWLFMENVWKLTDWLFEMPNLESLSITEATDGLEEMMTSEEFRAELEYHWGFEEFPKLDNLTSLKVVNPTIDIFNPLIKQNRHISSLKLIECFDEKICFNISLPNLVNLEFEFGSDDFLQKFIRSPNVEWPMLETLELYFINFEIKLPAILQVIKTKFDCTKLKTLVLDIPKAKNDKAAKKLFRDSKRCRLDLPNLNRLTLSLGDPTSLDFLLPMKDTLEIIKFEIAYPFNSRVKGVFSSTIVQFYGLENNILDSNIPSIFTRLRQIVFVDRYNRDKLYNL